MDSDSFSAIKFIYFFFFCQKLKRWENSCYRSCTHGKSLLCLQLHADEAKGSIQWKMTLQPRLCVKTTDNSDKSYSRVLPPPKANPLSQIGGRSLLKLQRFGHRLGCEIKSLSSNNLINIDLFEKETHFSTK